MNEFYEWNESRIIISYQTKNWKPTDILYITCFGLYPIFLIRLCWCMLWTLCKRQWGHLIILIKNIPAYRSILSCKFKPLPINYSTIPAVILELWSFNDRTSCFWSTPFVVSGRGEREVNRDVHLLPLIHHTLSNKNNLFTTCNHK